MDPLSTTASSIAIVTICSQVTSIITRWVSNVRKADSTLDKLSKELVILCTVLAAVKKTFERPGLGAIITLNVDSQLWSSITSVLANCRHTLRKLRRTLRELDTELESANLVRKTLKHVRFGKRSELIAALLGEVHSYHGLLQMLLQCTNICVTMHESMHNRAADAEILRQLSKMKSEIYQLKNAGESLNITEASTSEPSSQPHQSFRLKEPCSLDRALERTMHSVENFVDDSVSTVYARSTSGSEISQSCSGDTLLTTPSRFRKAQVDYEDEYRPSLSMIKLLQNRTVDDLNARIVNEAYDSDDFYASLKTLDDLELQRLAFYASSNGLDVLLDILITEYNHLINEPERFIGTTGMTLLHQASGNGKCSTINLLLQHGAQINAEDCNSMRPLVLALSMGKEDAAVFLIETGARITNPIPSYHSNLLMGAAYLNCAKVLQCLLLRGETEANTSMIGFTRLHAAVSSGSFEAVLFLLDYGFDMEGQDRENGWTPLMYACSCVTEDIAIRKLWSWFVRSEPATIVALLLERGADVNSIAPQGKVTPLRLAIYCKNFDVLALLLKYGVKIDIKSRLWLLVHAKDLSSALERQDC